ncbi:ATP-binding protein [Fontimonas sp. SYSU GA230001]|uniref:ATP-binding protein n=1 Tax=Fontimonas sp. SYSU GA230001 TaxID=3142450 RepID=UPI0032B39FD7
MPRSIRSRLLVSLLAAAAAVWIVSGIVAWRDALHEVDELLDAHLAQSAALLLAQAGELDEIDTEHLPLLHKYGRRVAFQVWEHGERLRLHSLNAPNTRLSRRDRGFADELIDGRRWRVFSVQQDEWLIQVAEESGARKAIGRSVGRGLLLPLLLGLPLLGMLIAWIVRRGLRPLALLSEEVGRRAPDQLAPLPVPADVGAELQPLLLRLNQLFAQLAESFESERRFTADAAHELRTPIAALKAQAQVAQRAGSDAERRPALDKVIQACDRTARLIDQLLTLARLEPAHWRAHRARTDLHALASGVAADLAPLALRRGIDLVLEGETVAVDGHADLLAVLLRNLLDNAIRYAPDHSTVRVRIGRSAAGVLLHVIDQGPGIERGLRDRLGQRFQRLGRADVEGTGLGLSIVRRIAELHGAALRFDDGPDGRGLDVVLTFPAPDS